MEVLHFEVIDSTNDFLKQNYANYPSQTVCVANHQTKGKGRMDRVWHDDHTQALFSLLLKPPMAHFPISMLSLYSGKIVHEILHKEIPNLKLKWPNDLWIEQKKVAGILIETIYEGSSLQAIIIGIGINVNTTNFSFEARIPPTSLKAQTNKHYEIQPLILDISNAFFQHLTLQNVIDSVNYHNTHSCLIGKRITYTSSDSLTSAKVIKVDEDGCLFVQNQDKVISLTSGEVSLVQTG